MQNQLAVLIVEDDPATQANLRDILELDSCLIELAGSIRQVTEHDHLEKFAIILLDRLLPDGDGLLLLPFLRDNTPATDVILITGHADLEGAIAALRHNVADFLIKPVQPELLRHQLSRIREQHQLQESLAEAQRRLVQSERLAAIGQTVATLTHEGRNELAALQIGLALLRKRPGDRATVLKVSGMLAERSLRLRRLFEDVRGFASPISLEPATCDLGEVWRKAWHSLEAEWQDRDTLFEEQTGERNLKVTGDPFRLEQVFRNLFENSLSACLDPVIISVSCVLHAGPETLAMRVCDNGPGLNQEQQQKVFEPFYTTRTAGTGLGMAIVRRIIESHGGTITAGNRFSGGAEFAINLPVAGRKTVTESKSESEADTRDLAQQHRSHIPALLHTSLSIPPAGRNVTTKRLRS
ncbi:MAG: hybrid sensor histidine kinase/response regulator [Planctomycetaceae bacterium]|nr:hybrid sensor histidine kinase/response regulator [Planctomycetaceae bacterium]